MASESWDDEEEAPEPVDTATLGRATWTFLHTLAANYPPRPSAEEQTRMRLFLSTFKELYPCEICRDGLKEIVRRVPPEVGSHDALTRWMCRLHNEVNDELGKPRFDCGKVEERWGVCESCRSHRGELNAFKQLLRNWN